MDIQEKTYQNYTYVVVSLNTSNDNQLIEDIKSKGEETAQKVNPKAPDGHIRPTKDIHDNNLGGELAQKVVELYIGSLIQKYGINAKIIHQEPKKYSFAEHRDIEIEVNGNPKTLEIRSSFSYKARTFERLLLPGGFSLLGPYKTSYKGNEPEMDFYVTVIHRYNNAQIESMLNDKVDAYITGGASKTVFKEKGHLDEGKLKQKGASYIVIEPIISVADVPTVFREILEI